VQGLESYCASAAGEYDSMLLMLVLLLVLREQSTNSRTFALV